MLRAENLSGLGVSLSLLKKNRLAQCEFALKLFCCMVLSLPSSWKLCGRGGGGKRRLHLAPHLHQQISSPSLHGFPQQHLQAQTQGWSGYDMYLAPTQSQTFPQGYCTDWCASREQIKVFQTSPAFRPAFLICSPWNEEKGVKGNNFIHPRNEFTQEGSDSSGLRSRWGKKNNSLSKETGWRKSNTLLAALQVETCCLIYHRTAENKKWGCCIPQCPG